MDFAERKPSKDGRMHHAQSYAPLLDFSFSSFLVRARTIQLFHHEVKYNTLVIE
jgi:hypothetical protein